MPCDRDEEPVGIAWIDRQLRNLLALTQSEMSPGRSGVGGFVNAVPDGKVWAMQAFTAADVDDVRIGRCNFDGAD